MDCSRSRSRSLRLYATAPVEGSGLARNIQLVSTIIIVTYYPTPELTSVASALDRMPMSIARRVVPGKTRGSITVRRGRAHVDIHVPLVWFCVRRTCAASLISSPLRTPAPVCLRQRRHHRLVEH